MVPLLLRETGSTLPGRSRWLRGPARASSLRPPALLAANAEPPGPKLALGTGLPRALVREGSQTTPLASPGQGGLELSFQGPGVGAHQDLSGPARPEVDVEGMGWGH